VLRRRATRRCSTQSSLMWREVVMLQWSANSAPLGAHEVAAREFGEHRYARAVQAPVMRSGRPTSVAQAASNPVPVRPTRQAQASLRRCCDTVTIDWGARQRSRAGAERKLTRRSRHGFHLLMQLEGFTCPDEVRQRSHGHLPHKVTSMDLDCDFT
jgi:hypothetical protein